MVVEDVGKTPTMYCVIFNCLREGCIRVNMSIDFSLFLLFDNSNKYKKVYCF